MPKKRKVKSKPKSRPKSKSPSLVNRSVDRILIENFVNLEKAHTNLAVKFESLSDQLSKLLQLFEISAKSFAEKTPTLRDVEKDKEFLDKLNVLLDQNKTIAKGLTLMEEKLRGRVYGSPQPTSFPQKPGFRPSMQSE